MVIKFSILDTGPTKTVDFEGDICLRFLGLTRYSSFLIQYAYQSFVQPWRKVRC
jgi:hypothetical protein